MGSGTADAASVHGKQTLSERLAKSLGSRVENVVSFASPWR